MAKVIGAAVAISALLSAAPAVAAGATYSGACVQVAAIVAADAAAVREHVPPGWPLYEIAGSVPLLVSGGTCRDSIEGGPQDFANRFGLVSAIGGPPDERISAVEGYDIWWLHSHPAEARMFRQAGFASPRVRRTSVEVHEQLGLVNGEARVPWRRSPFSVRVRTVAVSTPPAALTTYHWHAPPGGSLSLLRPDHTNLTLTAGTGEVTAAAGSPLAEMLGGTHATGVGGVLRFDYTAVIGPV